MDGRRTKSSPYGTRGTAARKLAIESLQNIANVKVGVDALYGTGEDFSAGDPELVEIIALVSQNAMPVAEVAKSLPSYDSQKVANALARGGKYGILTFSKEGDNTVVALAKGSAS
jgi:hypothetical protein